MVLMFQFAGYYAVYCHYYHTTHSHMHACTCVRIYTHVYVPHHPNLLKQDSKSLELNGFDLICLGERPGKQTTQKTKCTL